MSETREQYRVKEPNPSGIPSRWLRFLYRMASLERGRVYNMLIRVPEKTSDPVTWTLLGEGKEENG